jgi:hypothetical protein
MRICMCLHYHWNPSGHMWVMSNCREFAGIRFQIFFSLTRTAISRSNAASISQIGSGRWWREQSPLVFCPLIPYKSSFNSRPFKGSSVLLLTILRITCWYNSAWRAVLGPSCPGVFGASGVNEMPLDWWEVSKNPWARHPGLSRVSVRVWEYTRGETSSRRHVLLTWAWYRE